MKTRKVLFASSRPIERAENIAAIFNGYSGIKDFTQLRRRTSKKIQEGDYALIVTDEMLSEAHSQVILVGHGISGGKKSYLDQKNGYVKENEYKFLDSAITTSPEMIDISARQLGVGREKVFALGMPRTDFYFGKSKGDGGTTLSRKRAYLYVPTFRGKTDPKFPEIDFTYIDSVLSDDEMFVVKPHMLMGKMLKNFYRHVTEISHDLPSAPYLIDCDVVITDYSSIMFDGYLLGKPVVLFEKNRGYLDSRGMYLDYPYEYSSRYAVNEKELIDILRKADGLTEVEKRCIEKTAGSCDGHSTERVCEFIKQKVEEGSCSVL